jgi:Asp-tRNA(Asn)/Glu-tRNA(Gln) amidotransferase A subunit family amidase
LSDERATGTNLVPTSLRAAALALREGALQARSYCEACLGRIRASEPRIKAWISLDEKRALALADARDAARAANPDTEPGALHGVPVGVKDIYDTADLPTEMGSPAFVENRPGKDAALVERIIRAGGYALGKTATTEFAFMHPAETRNPWNFAHTPGGSSSGSAAAVAAGHVPAAIGTQTNGSVIRPAAYCGVVGFKPSFDALPVEGTLQFSATLDHAGVFARSVADAAYFAAALAGPESIDSSWTEALSRPPRIAFLLRFPWNTAEPDAAAHLQKTIERLKGAGATAKNIALPAMFDEAHLVHRTIMLYEGAREHAPRQAAHRRVMSAALNAAIDEGLAIAHGDYRDALARRGVLADRALALFEGFDVVASLPAPGAAPARRDLTGDPSFCTLWSLTGFPAITLPTGLAATGLPYGIQLAAPLFADNDLLRAALWCETAIGFDRSPAG